MVTAEFEVSEVEVEVKVVRDNDDERPDLPLNLFALQMPQHAVMCRHVVPGWRV